MWHRVASAYDMHDMYDCMYGMHDMYVCMYVCIQVYVYTLLCCFWQDLQLVGTRMLSTSATPPQQITDTFVVFYDVVM